MAKFSSPTCWLHRRAVEPAGRLFLAAACLIPLNGNAHTSGLVAVRVVIDSNWAGLNVNGPSQTHVVLEKAGNTYKLIGQKRAGQDSAAHTIEALPDRTVAAEDVAQLVRAMVAPVQAQISLTELQQDPASIQPTIDGALAQARLNERFPALIPEIRTWRDSLRKPQPLAALLTNGLATPRYDDGPAIRIQVTLSDGSMLRAASSHPNYLMLPWSNAHGELSYSTAIPRALDAVLPEQATNKARLNPHSNALDLDELIGDGIDHAVNRFSAETAAPQAVNAIEQAFDATDISIDTHQGHTALVATLRLRSGPPNVSLTTTFAVSGANLVNTATISRDRKILQRVQSSTLLGAHIKSAKYVDFVIFDEPGQSSLSAADTAQFVADMQRSGLLPELRSTPSILREAVLVDEGDESAEWVVLADGRAVRWQRSGAPAD